MDDNGPGRPPEVTDDEILDVFKTADEPVLTASEVADRLPIERRGLLTRLNDLEERGFLWSKKTGGRSAVWWYPGHTSTKPVEPER
jgi:predicted ArsR family transcriptional regulator